MLLCNWTRIMKKTPTLCLLYLRLTTHRLNIYRIRVYPIISNVNMSTFKIGLDKLKRRAVFKAVNIGRHSCFKINTEGTEEGSSCKELRTIVGMNLIILVLLFAVFRTGEQHRTLFCSVTRFFILSKTILLPVDLRIF